MIWGLSAYEFQLFGLATYKKGGRLRFCAVFFVYLQPGKK
ncbi:hypothetical protein MuYL_2106 [Mucilaginibacter xinganensis]|uniref:Uncharacterized protein n=1 Tax=Mucilaginibacter xinganensis TaxID=1234841 RepID=A0A223NVZ3_9SPHI|nr:hypothetical protein MuYL_2106 [Mucilaginibacter xinganensis]